MKKVQLSNVVATGFAMFSMFFGAGNVVFPLTLGRYSESLGSWAFFGLFLTAVVVPFLGLLSMALFDGDYRQFFARIGKVPGFLLTLLILGLIGPFGALPRCIVLAHSSLATSAEQIPLLLFSFLSCIVIFFCTYRRSRMLDILGFVLTPLLLFCLAIIVIKGIWDAPMAPESSRSMLQVFIQGLFEGYQTMDLLGAFFFSSVVLLCLRRELNTAEAANHPKLIRMTVKAGTIGMSLLTLIYWGFCSLSSRFSPELAGVAQENLLGKIALLVLGPHLGIVAALAVALACLTTAIALAAVFAEFLHEDIFNQQINFPLCLILTLIVSFAISSLEFEGIANFLFPILAVCYPALIILAIFNLFYKLFDFRLVKAPFYAALILSAMAFFF